MRRREFLWGLAALALGGSGSRVITSELPADEQREVVENLRRLPSSPEINLAEARLWLAGKETAHGRWQSLGGVPVRVLEGQSGSLLHLHGGGWCAGRATSGEDDLARLALDSGLTVVSVDYRLAPEHPFPAGPDDCERAARAFLREFPAPWWIRGVSAGAHLVVSTLIRLGPEAARFAGAVPYYGCYDVEGTASRLSATDADHPDLSPGHMAQFARWFVPAGDRRRGEVSPLYAELPTLPPALMLVGTQDILRDDTLRMAERWSGPCQVILYPEAPHGFDAYPTRMAKDAKRRERAFLTSR